MKKEIVLIAVICLCLQISVSGITERIPKKDHEVIVKTDQGWVCARILSVESQIRLKNDRFYWGYYHGKIFSKQGELQGKLLDGKYLEYDSDDNLIETGFFDKGLKIGIWKNLSSGGELIRTCNYKNGLLQGKSTTYKNGHPEKLERYSKGKLTGKPEMMYASFAKKDNWKNLKNFYRSIFKREKEKTKEQGKRKIVTRKPKLKNDHSS